MATRVGLQEVDIQDIWLMREGGENGLAYAVVYIQRDGVWYEAIRELIDSNFSHCISANGIVSESCKPVAWLNKPEPAQERSHNPWLTRRKPARSKANRTHSDTVDGRHN